jgi:hypothetical protein
VADDGAGVAPEVVAVGLERVEFLDHVEGDDHLVVGEHEQGRRVMQQVVGVEVEVFDVAVVAHGRRRG